MHDAQLINGIRKGDHDTFRFIFDHYYALMCSIAYEYVEARFINSSRVMFCSSFINSFIKSSSVIFA